MAPGAGRVCALYTDINAKCECSECQQNGKVPSRPRDIIPGLSAAMRAHLKYGVGGATQRTIDALWRRGLVEDAENRPGYIRLSASGRAVARALNETGCEACGKEFVCDPDTFVYDPACECQSCAKCGTSYEPDEPDAVTIAPSDELADIHDPHDGGMCAPCWRKRGVNL